MVSVIRRPAASVSGRIHRRNSRLLLMRRLRRPQRATPSRRLVVDPLVHLLLLRGKKSVQLGYSAQALLTVRVNCGILLPGVLRAPPRRLRGRIHLLAFPKWCRRPGLTNISKAMCTSFLRRRRRIWLPLRRRALSGAFGSVMYLTISVR